MRTYTPLIYNIYNVHIWVFTESQGQIGQMSPRGKMETAVSQGQHKQLKDGHQHKGRKLSEEIASLLRLKECRRLNPACYYTPRRTSQSQSLSGSTFKEYNEYVNEKDSSRAQRQNAAAVLSKLAHDFWENDCVIDEDIFEDSSDEEQS